MITASGPNTVLVAIIASVSKNYPKLCLIMNLEMAWVAKIVVDDRFEWGGSPPKYFHTFWVPLRSAHRFKELTRMLKKM